MSVKITGETHGEVCYLSERLNDREILDASEVNGGVIKPPEMVDIEVTEHRYLQMGLEKGPYLYQKYYLTCNNHERKRNDRTINS